MLFITKGKAQNQQGTFTFAGFVVSRDVIYIDLQNKHDFNLFLYYLIQSRFFFTVGVQFIYQKEFFYKLLSRKFSILDVQNTTTSG